MIVIDLFRLVVVLMFEEVLIVVLLWCDVSILRCLGWMVKFFVIDCVFFV